MNINAYDNTILVAPRPVRLTAPTPFPSFSNSILHRPQPRSTVRLVSAPADALDRLKLGDDPEDEPPSDREAASPRASPRSNLPSEAIEEFLSILRPSTTFLFRPTSPVLRATNSTNNGAYFPYRRPSCSMTPTIPSDGLGLTLLDQTDSAEKENEVMYPFRFWGSAPLGSPVARNLAKNPFQRHPSYDSAVTAYIAPLTPTPSPGPFSVALSPAAVPLPLPTPDEADFDVATA